MKRGMEGGRYGLRRGEGKGEVEGKWGGVEEVDIAWPDL